MELNLYKNYIIHVENLAIKYDLLYALTKISFTIEKGDFIALIGANGAGKSTLLNALYGLLTPTSGAINYNTTHLKSSLTAQNIGFSPQQLIIDWYLNVHDNVQLGALLGGVKPKNMIVSIVFRKFNFCRSAAGS